MKDSLLQSAYRELKLLFCQPRLWMTFCAVVALFTLTGPFGTFERLGPATRLGYWLSLHALAWLICMTFIVFADLLLTARIGANLLRMIIGGLAASPAIGLAIIAVNMVTLGDRFSWAALIAQIGTAIPVTLIMCLFVWLALDGQLASTEDTVPDDGSAKLSTLPLQTDRALQDRLLERLDPCVRAPVLHLSVEDHYVDVVTARGHQLVLMRFADALTEIDESAGLQVHRSHWVATRAVDRVVALNGRLSLCLTTGREIPVSRPYAAVVRNRFQDRITRI